MIEPQTSEILPQAAPAQKAAVLGLVILPVIGLVAAIVLLWSHAITWVELSLMAFFYTITGMGITIGFHRLFTHRSFETVRPIKYLLAIIGSMAVQGPMLTWVAMHRRHHQHSDHELDPHSPHIHGDGFWAVVRGFWHAHVGWMLAPEPPELARYVGDLREDVALRRISDLFVVWVALGLLIPAVIAGLITGTWTGALLGFLWGGLVRVFLTQHLTWSINSVCHIWGARDFQSDDESRNNVFFGVMAFGEGWHNNHHAFPNSARHGLRWWQLDISYLTILALSAVGLAWKIRLPSPEIMASRVRSGKNESVAPAATVTAERAGPAA